MFGIRKKNGTIARKDENFLFRGNGIIRFRPVFLLSLGFGSGILFACLFGMYSLFGILAFAAAAAAALLVCAVSKRRAAGILLFTAVLCSFYSLGSLSFSMRVGAFERSPAIAGECSVAGEVAEVGESGYYTLLTLQNLWIIGEDGEVLYPRAKMQVYVSGDADVRIGAIAMFDAEVQTYDVWAYGRINANAVIGNIRYRANVPAGGLHFSEGEGTDLFASVRSAMREILFANLDEQTASLAYGMLTGDSGYMDEDVLQNFRYGGVAHIFAVSGLHIGVIYGVLAALFKRLRLKSWLKIPVIFAALCLYAGVCGFSPSSVRALVMCTVSMLAEAGGYAYDRVNSVSAAALVVLTVHPVYLFSVGFQLSLAAAAGIVIVGGHLTRLLKRVRFLPEKFGSAAGVALSAQLATFPVLIDCFGYVSGISFFLNLVFVPLISIAYAFLFFCTLLSCLLPFAAPVFLFLPGYMLRIAVMPIMMLEFKVLLISGFSFGACAALWYLLLFLLTDKVNLKPVPKISAAGFLCVLLSAAMVFTNGNYFYEASLSLHSYYGNNLALLRGSGGDYLIAFGMPDERNTEQVFLQEGVRALRGVIFLTDAATANAGIPVLLEYVSAERVFVPEGSALIDSFQTVDIVYESGFFEFGDAAATFLGERLLYLNISGSDVLFDGGEESVPRLPHCDLFIANERNEALESAAEPQRTVYFEKTEGEISVYSAGSLQIGWKDAIIYINDPE